MEKEIGVYLTSVRPHLWGGLFESLSKNNVRFNVCITGPCPPIEPLPGNVKYIQTNVKPSQCFFIAANNTMGDYILLSADDCRYSDGALDDLIKIITDKNKSMVSSVFLGSCEEHHIFTLDPSHYPHTRSIRLPFPLLVSPLMKREDFNNIGIDRNFIALFFELDILFEFISLGGKTIVSENSSCTELANSLHLVNIANGHGDYARLVDMWIENDKIRNHRRVPAEPLVYNNTVLSVSQGPKLDCWD